MTKLLAILILFITTIQNISAQEDNRVLILQNKKTEKQKVVAPNSLFKAKTLENIKIKGRISEITDSFLISDSNDTIVFNKIHWIKAKKKLTKFERGAGIAGLFVGIIYTPASLIGTALTYAMLSSSPAIFLINAVPVGVIVISVRTLGGRRYKTKNWELHLTNAGISGKNE